MASPDDRKYTKTHEWVKQDGDTVIIGISDHAQDALGDITFIEMPSVGTKVTKGSEFGVIESVKAASDLYAPVSGEVTEVNDSLQTQPELINKGPYEEGWILKIKDTSAAELGELMDSIAYEAFLESEG